MTSEESERIAAIERRLNALESSLRALSAELSRQAQTPREPFAPRSWVPDELQPAHWLPKRIDVESLIGRYGTLVLATVSALAAVGTFLGWAISQGLLGPAQRIGLGVLLAIGLAVAGVRLRTRERSFGASLLALALAIVHVCAWGAGPSLRLLPGWVAFLLAAAASIALALFAHPQEDEPLWCVGFTGASVAPFVTASGKGNLFLLAAYGALVLIAASYAMSGRRWTVAGRLFLLSAAAYTAALATGFERQYGPLLAMAFPLVVGVGGVVPWTTGWPRRERLRALGALAALAALRTGLGMNLPISSARVAALLAAGGLVWLILVDRTHHTDARDGGGPTNARRLHEGDWLDAAVLPLAFILSAMMSLDATARGSGIAMLAAAGALFVTVTRSSQGSLRDASAFATVMCALVATLLLLRGRGEQLIGAIAVLSVLCVAANVVWTSASWTTLAFVGLGWAMLAAVLDLSSRPEYQYTPFATSASAIAAVVLVSILSARALVRDGRLEVLLRAGAVVWAFVWVHQEIAFAINETVATLFRVTYYAVTSVAAVGVGRARGNALLRHTGLGLAIIAAATALYGARNLEEIAARIAADLVAAVFLLGIAYWYRTPGGSRRAASA